MAQRRLSLSHNPLGGASSAMDHAKVVPHLARHLPRGFVARIYVSIVFAPGSALFCCGEDLRLGARDCHAAPSRNLTTLLCSPQGCSDQ